MQLYASATSPYVRKVRIALIELGLEGRVEIVPTAPTEDAGLRAINPLAKIPALRRSDGSVIYDSFVIIDWLEQTFGSGILIPHDAEARSDELRRHALANGILDATFNTVMELRRPEAQQSEFWIRRWTDAIVAGAAALVEDLPTQLTLSTITAASAADFVTFRLGHLNLDTRALTAWRASLGPRASLDTTLPQLDLA